MSLVECLQIIYLIGLVGCYWQGLRASKPDVTHKNPQAVAYIGELILAIGWPILWAGGINKILRGN